MTISTEQFIAINIGTSANDGTGDPLRTSFTKLNNNFANITDIGFDAGNINVQGSIEVHGNISVDNNYIPGTAAGTGTTGQITYDSDYVYICVATNTWKRANLATW